MPSTRRAPDAETLFREPVVQQALALAWRDSLPDDPAGRHEEGGWVYLNPATGEFAIHRAPAGQQAELDIGSPPLVAGSVLVTTFHTHPNPTADGWEPGPNSTDEELHARLGVPGLIRADDGDYVAGPAVRRGGLTGPAGFPM